MNRLKVFATVAMIALAVMIFAAPHAYAQSDNNYGPEIARNWSVRLGPYFFNHNIGGSTVGVSAIVERTVFSGETYDVTVGIGYNGTSDIYSVPALINLIGHHNRMRYGFGVGIAFDRLPNHESTNGLAANALLGFQLTGGRNPTTIDLRYYFIGSTADQMDGFGLTYGIKF